MVVPKLNTLVPIKFIPVAAELPVVAPVITHFTLAKVQLSEAKGSGTTTLTLQALAGALTVILAGQTRVGGAFSTIVTVKLQVF